ncbi:cytochrome c peroxidase [Leptolyngbya sp. FACHB-8]|uniref:cytochrome-c peroxidase n=1 Tax=unclassified Leptolyngbya TaxID=2650499 RepID=UPI0016889E31|nr:cytochrome c peroxidase [Leptolyngbya sp. FACHB-8]MBD1913259.1 cytochrome B6 [Leptolyngbya sp. FACHB-8]
MRFDRLDRIFQRPQERRPRRWIILVGLIGTAILIALLWQRLQPDPIATSTQPEITITSSQNEPIQPIPLQVSLDKNKVQLGEKLFADTRISTNNQVSCLSCHHLDQGGADRQVRSIGATGVRTQVNTPTVFNIGYNFRFSWNGRFETLEAQNEGLAQNVMGLSWEQVIPKLQQVPDYVQLFNAVYADGITLPNVIDAIAVYERSLITPNSRFDQFLRGDYTVLTVEEQEGYRLFKSYGCVSCHQGVNVGGNLFQKFGEIGNYFADRGNITPADYGYYNVTGSENDRFVFRVPSLRNVAITPPYFHDGTAQTLEQAIAVMAKYQLGRPLPQAHVRRIAQFLKTLTGEPPRSAS